MGEGLVMQRVKNKVLHSNLKNVQKGLPHASCCVLSPFHIDSDPLREGPQMSLYLRSLHWLPSLYPLTQLYCFLHWIYHFLLFYYILIFKFVQLPVSLSELASLRAICLFCLPLYRVSLPPKRIHIFWIIIKSMFIIIHFIFKTELSGVKVCIHFWDYSVYIKKISFGICIWQIRILT